MTQDMDWGGAVYERAQPGRRRHVQEEDDHCDQDGAARLKQIIEDYWARKGHIVTATIIEQCFHPTIRASRFDVRSDLLNGLPRDWKSE